MYIFQETEQPMGIIFEERVQSLEISYLKDIYNVREGRLVLC